MKAKANTSAVLPPLAGVVVTEKSGNRIFGLDAGEKLDVEIKLDELPWSELTFIKGLVLEALKGGIARKGEKIIAGETPQDGLINLCRQEGSLNKRFYTEADGIMDSMAEEEMSWEDLDDLILKKYGWKLLAFSREGLAAHCERRSSEAKPASLADQL